VTDAQRTVLQRVVYATGVDDLQCRIPFHVYAGESDQIVPAASAQAAFPQASVLPSDHFSILDPGTPGSAALETVNHHVLADLAVGQINPPTAAAPAGTGPEEATGKYRVNIKDSQGVVVGDHNRVSQSFEAPGPQPGAQEDDASERP
jgi:hypothetical protein